MAEIDNPNQEPAGLDEFIAPAPPIQAAASEEPAGLNEFVASAQEPEGLDDFVKQAQYGTREQQLKTAAEGAAQGFAGPLATYAETHLLGVKPEDIVGRQEANPWIHGTMEAAGLGAGLLTGTGEAGLIARGAERLVPEAATVAGKIGAAALKGGIFGTLSQGGDEMTKAMLGQGDPQAPVASALAHMGAAGILGGTTGGLFNVVGQGASAGLRALENNKMGDKAASFLRGMGVAASKASPDMEEAVKTMDRHSEAAYNAGKKFFDSGMDKGARYAVDQVLSGIGGVVAGQHGGSIMEGIATYAAIHKIFGNAIEKIVGKTLTPAMRWITIPTIGKALSMGETKGLFDAMNYAQSVAKGSKAVQRGVDSLFAGTQVGGQQIVNAFATDSDRKKIKDFIENGGVNQQIQNQLQSDNQGAPNYADGGQVAPQDLQEPDAFGTVFPEQSGMLSEAKGRIYNYLNGLRPQDQPQLPFDSKLPQDDKQRSYNRAIDIAASPLTILGHIQNGTIQPEHVQHFGQLYPELHSYLSQKINERMAEHQLKGKRPSYKIRQGLSMFLASPVDSTFTPNSIRIAQSVSQSGQQMSAPPQQGAPKAKNSKAPLTKMATNAQTNEQARAARAAKI